MTVVEQPVELPGGWWHLNLDDGAALQWHGCQCGAPTPCPPWLVAGTRTCELYPCGCDEEDLDPPGWLLEQMRAEGVTRIRRCRPYLAKKGKFVGLWNNVCRCWGRPRDDRLPESCCVWHDGNPPYAPRLPDGSLIRQNVVQRPQEPRDDVDPPSHAIQSGEGPAVSGPLSGAARRGDPVDGSGDVLPLAQRGWPIEVWSCVCPTPWDDANPSFHKPPGYHCINCHENFRNAMVAQQHRRDWRRGPCLAPSAVVDCVTGAPLLGVKDVNGFLVWG
jgi:hypothetical protein